VSILFIDEFSITVNMTLYCMYMWSWPVRLPSVANFLNLGGVFTRAIMWFGRIDKLFSLSEYQMSFAFCVPKLVYVHIELILPQFMSYAALCIRTLT